MRGVEFGHLSALVDFLYLGEANVLQDEIESFLAVATELKLKGFSGEAEYKEVGKYVSPPTSRPKKESKAKKVLASTEMVEQIEDFDKKPPVEKTVVLFANYDRVDADMDRLDEQIDSMIETTDRSDPKSGKLVACKVGGKDFFLNLSVLI